MQRSFGKRFLIYFLALFVPAALLGAFLALTTNDNNIFSGVNLLILAGQALFCMVIISAVIALSATQRKSRDSRVMLAIMGIWCLFPLLTAPISIREAGIPVTILGILLFCCIPVGYCLPVSFRLRKKEREAEREDVVNSIAAEN